MQERRLHPTIPELRQSTRAKLPGDPSTQCQRRPAGNLPIDPREIAFRILPLRKHPHDAQKFLRHRIMLRESLRHCQRPQINLTLRRFLNFDSIGQRCGSRLFHWPHHHIRKFAHVIPALPVMLDQRPIRHRASFYPHRLPAAEIKLLQSIKRFFADRPAQSKPHRLRDRRIRSAINRIASADRSNCPSAISVRSRESLRTSNPPSASASSISRANSKLNNGYSIPGVYPNPDSFSPARAYLACIPM